MGSIQDQLGWIGSGAGNLQGRGQKGGLKRGKLFKIGLRFSEEVENWDRELLVTNSRGSGLGPKKKCVVKCYQYTHVNFLGK